MKSIVLFAFLYSLTLNFVIGSSCGGLLEGEQGHFSLANSSKKDHHETPGSSCLWIIQLHYENDIRFTLDAIEENTILNLYPEDQLTSCSLSNHTKKVLNSTDVGSSFEFLGKTLIVVLPNSSASVSFTWHFTGDNADKNASIATMMNADYIDSPNGLLEWGQLETVESMTWGINTDANLHIKWDVDATTSCDATDSCACFYFKILQLTSAGVLSEAVRTCGQSSEGKLEGVSGRFVVLIKVNTKVGANKIAVSWGLDDVIVTESPVTEPPVTTPVPFASGLFAATETGLIALNLQTLEATTLTTEPALAVDVNQNLEKVYWSENVPNCRIMRSNFNGFNKEIIVLQTGRSDIYALAIHEPSGNVYFSVNYSYKMTVCDALGENCAVVISSSSLLNYPYSLSLDYENNLMYWSSLTESLGTSLFRANLDGSDVTIISSGFSISNPVSIKLAEPFNNGTLYWAYYAGNTIGTIDVNGSNKRTLVELDGNPGPSGIQVDAHRIYIGNYWAKNIQSIDRDSGENLTTIFNCTGIVYKLALFGAPA